MSHILNATLPKEDVRQIRLFATSARKGILAKVNRTSIYLQKVLCDI